MKTTNGLGLGLALAIALAIVDGSPCEARADPTPEEVRKNAKDYEAEGVTFKTSLKDFLKLHPKAMKAQSIPAQGLVKYAMEGNKSGADFVVFVFIDDELYQIGTIYSKKNFDKKFGGVKGFVNDLGTKYGRPTSTEEKATKVKAEWEVSKVDRLIRMEMDDNSVMLFAEDTAIAKKLKGGK